MGKRKLQADHRADTKGGRWAGIPHVVLQSEAYRTLSLCARAVLFELVLKFNGFNNGTIALSQREIAARLGNSNFKRISRAIGELMERGFIDLQTEGRWKPRLAREYRLTFVSSGKSGHARPATNEYRGWAQIQTRAATGSTAALRGADPGSALALTPVEDASAVAGVKAPKATSKPAGTGSALIVKPSEVAPKRWNSGREKGGGSVGSAPANLSTAPSAGSAVAVALQMPP